jgi:hypothetical protein
MPPCEYDVPDARCRFLSCRQLHMLVVWLQAYDEATRDADVPMKQTTTRRLILDSAPRPQTEATVMQPANRDRLTFEQRPAVDGWLY